MSEKKVVSGVLLLNKPQGITSQQVVSKVKNLLKSSEFNSKKAGHTGTLDPMATGLLPICLGEATKFSHYQLDAVKTYQAVVKLGQQTDTGDQDGGVILTASIPPITSLQLQHIAKQFFGKIWQIPPMYSALKKDGKKLYELARAGIEISRPAREIEIFSLNIGLLSSDLLQINVTCSKGTYVRVLGEDIAKALGTVGHLVALERMKTGDFCLQDAISLADFQQLTLAQRLACLLPVDACVRHLNILSLDNEQRLRILQGQRLNVRNLAIQQNILLTETQQVRLFYFQQFLGIAELQTNGRLQPLKLVV